MAGSFVDDERNIRELIKCNVEKSGYTVLETDNGQMAVTMVKAEKPDLIVKMALKFVGASKIPPGQQLFPSLC